MKYNLYRYVDVNGIILYVGKTTQLLSRRINQHVFDQAEYITKTDHIEYAEANNKTDLSLYEIYYINLFKPKYNISQKYDQPTIIMPELQWHRFNKYHEVSQKHQEVSQKNKAIKAAMPGKKFCCVKSAEEIAAISQKHHVTYYSNRIIKEKEHLQFMSKTICLIEDMSKIVTNNQPQFDSSVIYSYKYTPNKEYSRALEHDCDLMEFVVNKEYLYEIKSSIEQISSTTVKRLVPPDGTEYTSFGKYHTCDNKVSILFQSGEISGVCDTLHKTQDELTARLSIYEKKLSEVV